MYCRACGAPTPATARFCRNCGRPVIVPGPQPVTADQSFREVYRNTHIFGSRVWYILVRGLRTVLIMALCAALVAYGVYQIRAGAVGRNAQTAITYALMAIAALAIPATPALELQALRRFDAARRYVAGGRPLAWVDGHPRWSLTRNSSDHVTLRSGNSTADVNGGTFSVGDHNWDLDDISDWRRLYVATGRPGGVPVLNVPGVPVAGGGTATGTIARAWYVPETRVLVRVEARPATPTDQA